MLIVVSCFPVINMKFLIIISSILSVAVAQQVRCNYIFNEVYMCQLSVTNPNGFNNFTQIYGTHLPGMGNTDVELVQWASGSSPILPQIVCDLFPNTGYLSLYGAGLTRVDDTSFRGCRNVKDISLQMNSISSITVNAFANNRAVEHIGLSLNNLATVPENLFANQQNLQDLMLGNNPLQSIPDGLFRPLVNIEYIHLESLGITEINNQWFANNTNLHFLDFRANRIVLTPNSFVGMESLIGLNLEDNAITEIPDGSFAPLQNLEELLFTKNQVRQFSANSFTGLGNLFALDVSGNPLGSIPNGTFQNLPNLSDLDLTFCNLTSLNANSFQGLNRLSNITLNTNQIEELPVGLFTSNLNSIYILNNRLRRLNRRSFGELSNMFAIALEGNLVNAIDREVIDHATNLNYLYMNGNGCANFFFHTFQLNRQTYLPMLQTCFQNAALG